MPNDQDFSTDALRVEIDRLCERDSDERKRKFASLVRTNVRHWNQRQPGDLPATRWELLEARLARLDATYADDLGSIFYAQAKADLTQLLSALVNGSDPTWIIRCPRRLALLRRMLPRDAERVWGARA